MILDQLRSALSDAEQDLRVVCRARGWAEHLGHEDEFADADAAMARAAERVVDARAALNRHASVSI